MKNLFFVSAGALLFVSNCHASDWSERTKVTEINAGYKNGVILFKTEKTHNNPNKCNSDFYFVSDEDSDSRMILSILLSSQRSGSEVMIGVDSSKCSSGSVGQGRISVSRVRSLS